MPRPAHYRPGRVQLRLCQVCGYQFRSVRRDARCCGEACRQALSRYMRQHAALKANVVSTKAPKLNATLKGAQNQ